MQADTTGRLRQARAALAVSFLLQGATFALLVTCIPEIQRQYGLGDGLLPVFLAAVPILAGVGSITSEQLVKRTSARTVLRIVQPAVCLALAGVGLGGTLWQLALALGAFGLLVGALDASMNMLGVGLQHRYGRSIMLGFHAAFSLGGIVGAAVAGLGAHGGVSLTVLFGGAAAVLVPLSLLVGTGFAGPAELGDAVREAAEAAGRSIPWRPLLPLCLAMAVAYIADASVSNYSVKYLADTLHSPDDVAKLSYLGYMVAMLLGRTLGDRGVQRWGPSGSSGRAPRPPRWASPSPPSRPRRGRRSRASPCSASASARSSRRSSPPAAGSSRPTRTPPSPGSTCSTTSASWSAPHWSARSATRPPTGRR
ncbi:hypothetical protein GCM10025734_39550 [Kitasatospora paranensis]